MGKGRNTTVEVTFRPDRAGNMSGLMASVSRRHFGTMAARNEQTVRPNAETKQVLDIVKKHISKQNPKTGERSIVRGESIADDIGREIAKTCNVEFEGSGMTLLEDPQRYDMFFLSSKY